MEVIIYSQPSCMPCKMVKTFLDNQGIKYVEKNVREDQDALAELKNANYSSTPVTFIDGKAVAGFNPEQLSKALGL